MTYMWIRQSDEGGLFLGEYEDRRRGMIYKKQRENEVAYDTGTAK